MDTMPILTRRRIEAEFARGIYDEMKAELGETEAKRILSNAVIKLARAGAAAMATAMGSNDMDAFRARSDLWRAEDALRVEVLESTDKVYDFNVLRCRYAEMYRELGVAELGAILSCNRDGSFCEGWNDKLKLTRTQTIMAGASHCDFRYRMEE
jgi:hypothetical protein